MAGKKAGRCRVEKRDVEQVSVSVQMRGEKKGGGDEDPS